MDVINPLGEKERIDLEKQTSNTFTSKFETLIPGIYEVEITKLDQSGNVISKHFAYTSFSYSKEYDGFYSDYEVFDIMKNLAKTGSGEILFEIDGIFQEEAQKSFSETDPNFVLFIVALVLFLLDIVTRKFKFKWPHEWFRKKDQINYHINKN